VRPVEDQHLAAPRIAALSSGAQTLGQLRRDPNWSIALWYRDFEARARGAVAFAHLQEQSKAYAFAFSEPQAAPEATNRFRLSDISILVLRWSDCGSLFARLDQIGKTKPELATAQPRAEELVARRFSEKLLKRLLQIRPHPMRKIAARDDQIFRRDRCEVRGERAVQCEFS